MEQATGAEKDVPVDPALQGLAASEFAAEGRGIHTQRGSRALHHGTHRRHVNAGMISEMNPPVGK